MLAVAADPAPTIKTVNMKEVSAASGQQMFTEYCAACHGVDAKGRGPAASAMKVPPPDLTLLAQKNNGKFPGVHVLAAIRGDGTFPAHGSKDMPVWGNLFREKGEEAEVIERLANLCHYIESLQARK